MIFQIDYPDVAIHTTASNITTRPHALRRGSASASTDRISVDNVTDPYTSSSEVSFHPVFLLKELNLSFSRF